MTRNAIRAAAVVGAACFVAFWTWALFFASKEAVNRIGDRQWAGRAEQICAGADEARIRLADFRDIREAGPELIAERADLVDASTEILAAMIDEVTAVGPTDDKGRAIVPMWADEYRTYLDDRREYADDLRAAGANLAFYETEAGGIPISERLETFAGDNDMPSCAPPIDLAR